MDYYKFLDEFNEYDEWNRINEKYIRPELKSPMWGEDAVAKSKWLKSTEKSYHKPDVKDNRERTRLEGPHDENDAWLNISQWTGQQDDRVNSPSHYTSGKTEVIDVIEDAVKDAPSNIFGMLQAQVIKYILRVWLKDNPLEDLKKARWYLDRLINHVENYPGDNPPPSNV